MPAASLIAGPVSCLGPTRPLLLVSFNQSNGDPRDITTIRLTGRFMPRYCRLPVAYGRTNTLCRGTVGDSGTFTLLVPTRARSHNFTVADDVAAVVTDYLTIFTPRAVGDRAFHSITSHYRTVLASLNSFDRNIFNCTP